MTNSFFFIVHYKVIEYEKFDLLQVKLIDDPL